MAATVPSRRARQGARLAIVLLLVAAAIVGWNARARPGELLVFLPMYAVATFVIDGLTAYLLAIQFVNSRQVSLGIVAAAYGFSAPLPIIQLAAIPGIFAPAGLMAAGTQVAIWIWLVWHATFPSIVIAALLYEYFYARKTIARKSFFYARRAVFILPTMAAVAIAACLIELGPHLPRLIVSGSYAALWATPIGLYALNAHALAFTLALVIGRWRDLLNLWLSVALLCGLLDVLLTLMAGERYTLGWYAARVLSVGTGGLVLGIILWEINRLYAQLSYSNRRLSDLASHDGLTGVRNRRYFDEAIQTQVRRAKERAVPLSLLMFDVDFFKRYNDSFGHQSGDSVLVRIAQALRDATRGELDTVCRYGGEEFVALCPDCDARGALAIAERMREAVMALGIAAPANPEGRTLVTVSVGVATLGVVGLTTPDQLIAAADRALYSAKNHGRNRTIAYAPELTATSMP